MSSQGEESPQYVDDLLNELDELDNQNESSFYEESSSTHARNNSDTEIIPIDAAKPVFPTASKLLSDDPEMKAVSNFNSYV
jgi:hypothetical protein